MTASERITAITQRLQQAFNPSELNIEDTSHEHAGHASAKGAGHYTVNICAATFNGKKSLQQHRMIFKALDDLMPTEIHALVIKSRAET